MIKLDSPKGTKVIVTKKSYRKKKYFPNRELLCIGQIYTVEHIHSNNILVTLEEFPNKTFTIANFENLHIKYKVKHYVIKDLKRDQYFTGNRNVEKSISYFVSNINFAKEYKHKFIAKFVSRKLGDCTVETKVTLQNFTNIEIFKHKKIKITTHG